MAAAFALLQLAAGPLHAETAAASSFYGDWKIVKVAGYGDVSSGASEAESGLDKPVVITATSIILPDDPCDKHALTYATVNVDSFLRQRWQTSRSALDLGGLKLGKTTSHIDAACADALVLDGNDLLATSGSGAFYILQRAK